MAEIASGGFRQLGVWQRACDYAEAVYDVTKNYPKDELFGLTSQTRRAVVSIAANISEGASRFHKNEFAYHVSVAAGSLAETRTLLELAVRFDYLDKVKQSELDKFADEMAKMIYGLIRSLKNQN